MSSEKCRPLSSSLSMTHSVNNSIWRNACENTILCQTRNDTVPVLLALCLFRPSYGNLWHLFITSQRPSTSVLLVVLHVQMGKTATEQRYVYFAKGTLTHWGLLTHIFARDVGHHRLTKSNDVIRYTSKVWKPIRLIWEIISICAGNELAPKRRQPFIWTPR